MPLPPAFQWSDQQQFRDNTPFQGGWIRNVPSQSISNVNFGISHGLKRIPRGVQILNISNNAVAIQNPPAMGTTAWRTDCIFLRWAWANTAPVTLLIF